jgi:hypothetical protein
MLPTDFDRALAMSGLLASVILVSAIALGAK